ncbi:MAG TPA: glycosyltransferase, partial [Chloroflexota bacterium]|nr:glycosyltransferase [Chloroflexota bacterium]
MELSFTVIIPARNAASVLGKCLSSVVSKGAGGSPLEVIVVDDGSTDDTVAVAKSHGARVVYTGGLGPAAARNAGARVASGDLLVFLDADCVAEQGCLEALLAPFADPAVAGSRGGYTSDQEALLARFVQLEMDEKQARLEKSGLVTLLDTACAAYRRTLFTDQGGFDERLPATSVEDAELSFRLTAQGYHLVYAPSARVRHRHPEQLGNYLWRKLRYGYFRALLYRRYPARVRNDGYTPRLMPVQILLAGIVMAAGGLGIWSTAGRTIAAAAAMLFLLASVPLSRRAWGSDHRLAMATPFLLLLRSCAQGLGLLAGVAQLAKGSRSTRWVGGALTIVSLATLALLVLRSDWQQLIRPLAEARPEWLAVAIGTAFAVEVAKTVRWQLLLGLTFGDLPRLLALVFTGRLLNVLAPLRAGDLWRVASAATSEGQPVLVAGGSVVAEKALDGAALAAAGIVLVWLPRHTEGWILLP